MTSPQPHGTGDVIDDLPQFVGQARFDAVVAERDAWVRSWNRLEAAISHHKKNKSELFVDEVDEALYAARDRILRERSNFQPEKLASASGSQVELRALLRKVYDALPAASVYDNLAREIEREMR